MNILLGICLVIVTAAIVVAVVYLVQTLIQLKQTAQQVCCTASEAEKLLKSINAEASVIAGISNSIAGFFGNAVPYLKFGSLFTGIISNFFKKRDK